MFLGREERNVLPGGWNCDGGMVQFNKTAVSNVELQLQCGEEGGDTETIAQTINTRRLIYSFYIKNAH